MKAINVIEYSDNNVQAVYSFPDNDEGYKEAVKCFSQLIEQYDSDAYFDDYVMEGIFKDGSNEVYLAYSEN